MKTRQTGNADKALQALAEKLRRATKVRVGFLDGATYPDGKPVAMVAAIQEYGAPSVGIPPRPFFRTMIKQHQKDWAPLVKELLQQNGGDTKKTLDALGEEMIGELQQSIIDMNDPALSPVTVMLRGMRKQKRYRDLPFGERIAIAVERVEQGKTNYGASEKPLVDTGVMLAAANKEVT